MRKISEETPIDDFVDAVDVKNIYLYRKDGYIMSYLRVNSFNLDLLSNDERNALTESLTAKFLSNRKDFTYASFPRQLDLDSYKKHLKEKHQQEFTIGKRNILSYMMKQGTKLTMDGTYEHHHFIRIWEIGNRQAHAEEVLKNRIEEFKKNYQESGIKCEILNEKEMIKLCNLFGNGLQANFEHIDNSQYTPLTWIE